MKLAIIFLLSASCLAQQSIPLPLPVKKNTDIGRSFVTLTVDAATPAASDTLLTFAKNVGGTVTASQTSYQVSSGKTLRIQGVYISQTQSGTTAVRVRVRLRQNSAGACIATSNLLTTTELAPNGFGTSAANLGNDTNNFVIPDGLELSGATQNICFSAIASSAASTLSVTLVGYEY